jgi:hypothetical protein
MTGVLRPSHASDVGCIGPEEHDVSDKTLEEALAWCLVWLMAPELGIAPFLVGVSAAALLKESTAFDTAQVAAHERRDAVVIDAMRTRRILR